MSSYWNQYLRYTKTFSILHRSILLPQTAGESLNKKMNNKNQGNNIQKLCFPNEIKVFFFLKRTKSSLLVDLGTIATQWRTKVVQATNNNGQWPKQKKELEKQTKKKEIIKLRPCVCVCFVRKTEHKPKRKNKIRGTGNCVSSVQQWCSQREGYTHSDRQFHHHGRNVKIITVMR